MCSTPKLKKTKQSRTYQKAIAMEMDQASYSRMIQQANSAYEKRHPESIDEPVRIRKKVKTIPIPRSLSYWLTKASLTELGQLLARNISIN